MRDFLGHIRALVAGGAFKITEHAFIELLKDDLIAQDVIAGLALAVVVEDYPDYHKGPSVLVLQADGEGKPVHALWGLVKGQSEPAHLITAYRPDPAKWMPDLKTRRPK